MNSRPKVILPELIPRSLEERLALQAQEHKLRVFNERQARLLKQKVFEKQPIKNQVFVKKNKKVQPSLSVEEIQIKTQAMLIQACVRCYRAYPDVEPDRKFMLTQLGWQDNYPRLERAILKSGLEFKIIKAKAKVLVMREDGEKFNEISKDNLLDAATTIMIKQNRHPGEVAVSLYLGISPEDVILSLAILGWDDSELRKQARALIDSIEVLDKDSLRWKNRILKVTFHARERLQSRFELSVKELPLVLEKMFELTRNKEDRKRQRQNHGYEGRALYNPNFKMILIFSEDLTSLITVYSSEDAEWVSRIDAVHFISSEF